MTLAASGRDRRASGWAEMYASSPLARVGGSSTVIEVAGPVSRPRSIAPPSGSCATCTREHGMPMLAVGGDDARSHSVARADDQRIRLRPDDRIEGPRRHDGEIVRKGHDHAIERLGQDLGRVHALDEAIARILREDPERPLDRVRLRSLEGGSDRGDVDHGSPFAQSSNDGAPDPAATGSGRAGASQCSVSSS